MRLKIAAVLLSSEGRASVCRSVALAAGCRDFLRCAGDEAVDVQRRTGNEGEKNEPGDAAKHDRAWLPV